MRQCPKSQLLQCPIGPTSAIVDQISFISLAHNFRTLTLLSTKLLLLPDLSQKKRAFKNNSSLRKLNLFFTTNFTFLSQKPIPKPCHLNAKTTHWQVSLKRMQHQTTLYNGVA